LRASLRSYGRAHDVERRRHAGPELEGGRSLGDEHAEAVDDAGAGRLCCAGGRRRRIRKIDERLAGAQLDEDLVVGKSCREWFRFY
jgi:hypothetical protein